VDERINWLAIDTRLSTEIEPCIKERVGITLLSCTRTNVMYKWIDARNLHLGVAQKVIRRTEERMGV
jgi:hypothetical protein